MPYLLIALENRIDIRDKLSKLSKQNVKVLKGFLDNNQVFIRCMSFIMLFIRCLSFEVQEKNDPILKKFHTKSELHPIMLPISSYTLT
jgi:hypothetical protein